MEHSTRTHTDPARTPVIIGVGEITWRDKDPAHGLEPIALMEAALRAAQEDALAGARPHAGTALLQGIDALDMVCEHSWPYADAPALLCERLHIRPRHRAYAAAGGESPVRLLHEAALRIAAGESAVAAVVGAESSHTVATATKAGLSLPWSPKDTAARLLRGADICHSQAVRHGVVAPVNVYPFYENAVASAWGQSPAQALRESALLWSSMSQAAARNPHAWQRQTLEPDDIATPSERNRLIAWPYTLRMVANPLVNMGAAVLLTSLEMALELGIAPDRMVHVWGGASAQEPRDYLARDHYGHAPAQEAVLEEAQRLVDGKPFDLLELYSCFPVVPKMARRTLGLPANAPVSATGGLSFFGAPLNNYMTHAVAALVRGLRQAPEHSANAPQHALLYGQGEFVTKHHAMVLSTQPPPPGRLRPDHSVQAQADRRRGPVPPLTDQHEGPATVETHTVVYGREGQPDFGIVIARTPDGQRLMSRVAATDTATLARLTALDRSPVGQPGTTSLDDDGRLHWRFTA